MYMLFEADAAFIFISSVSVSYIPRISVNYLSSSDRHQQPSGSGPDVLPSGENAQFARGGGVGGGGGGVKIRIAGFCTRGAPAVRPTPRIKSVTNPSFSEMGDSSR